MSGIVMMNLKNSISEEVDKRLQEMANNKDRTNFLSEILHDTLAYLNEEELREVEGWVTERDLIEEQEGLDATERPVSQTRVEREVSH